MRQTSTRAAPGVTPVRNFAAWGPLNTAILLVLLIVGAIEMAQYLLFEVLPPYYHHLSSVVQGALILGLIILYARWRNYATYAEGVVETLRQSEQWREDMSAMLVHDLKNPVISSTLALQAVLRRQARKPVLSEQEMEYLRMAQESQIRLSNMIGDLMTIAQAEGDTIPLQLERVDLCDIAARVVREMGTQAERGQIDLAHDCQGPIRLIGDRFRLRRVIENLLANALRFTPAGGQVRVSVAVRGDELELRVADTGQGIPEEAQAHIFHKFGQAATGSRMSIGLGLTFCKLIAEAHGGSIRVESQPGQGSTFIVRLPTLLRPEEVTARYLPPEAVSAAEANVTAGEEPV